MPLVLSEADDADFDRLMEIQFAAFGQTGDSPREPFIDVIYPGGDTPSGQAAARDRVLKSLHSDPTATFLKVTDTITGEIIGGARWQVYTEKPELKHAEVDWWEGEDKEYAEFVLNILHRGRFEKTAAEGPYLCELLCSADFIFCCLTMHPVLDVIFTDPKHQHRGAGSKLVKWGVDRADELGVEAFLESTRFGRHMYEQNGFQITESVTFQVPEKWAGRPKIHNFFMRRPAVRKVV